MDIAPDKQNLNTTFSNTTYYIDFYQREYKWGREQVETLLDDVFYKFNLEYVTKGHLEASEKTITDHYPWYYLNTYVTNQSEGRTYVVDGQQRLTTLTLVLIKLYHLCTARGLKRANWVHQKIAAYDSSGEMRFWMGQGKRAEPLRALFEGDEYGPGPGEVTAASMVANYAVISDRLDKELGEDEHKTDTFTLYFLHRLVLIDLKVGQTDVPMVFEVINDRGISLRSHEILKGKLLGQIPKGEVDRYNETWEGLFAPLDATSEPGKKGSPDDFFSTYFKARFEGNRKESNAAFENDYQRAVFAPPYNDELRFKHEADQGNVAGIRDFIAGELPYYVGLYARVRRLADPNHFDPAFAHVGYNGLTDIDLQTLLVLAACGRGDPQEDEKLRAVSRGLDRYYTLLQLNRAYDSNRFADSLYEIRTKLKGASVEEYAAIFDDALVTTINERRGTSLSSPFHYPTFKQLSLGDLNKRFQRYFFARVEEYLADGIKREMQGSLKDLVTRRGPVNGYHIEHIIARNDENLMLFGDPEDPATKEVFDRERNRLGALLLLLGRDNQSSGKESYEAKLATYSGTLYWNQSLREDFYKSKLNTLDFIKRDDLDLRPVSPPFDQEAIEHRTEVLFDIVRHIWG